MEHKMNVEEILKNHYNILQPAIKELGGYDSTNTLVQVKEKKYVLKQDKSSEMSSAFLLAEHNVRELLNDALPYDFPKTITTQNGKLEVNHGSITNRLLSFVEGTFLAETEHTNSILQSFGRFLGDLHTVLSAYSDPIVAFKEDHWDLQHFIRNKRFVDSIENPKDRTLVNYFFLQFQEQVLPVLPNLRKAIIHGDANDWNVLTKEGKVSGIIDFGDLCYSPIINDLAIGLAYLLFDKDNPLEAAKEVIKAYHRIFPLEEQEVDLLYYLIGARLCTSVCNSAYKTQQSTGSAHTSASEVQAWKLLRKWISINPLKATDSFRAASGFPCLIKSNIQKTIEEREQFFSTSLSISYSTPIEMHQSALQYMYDTEGNTFLDAYNNIMIVGHCHPKVVQAGQQTMARLNTNTRYLYPELNSYAKKLLNKFPPQLNKIFLVNSGSAASDLAIRLAMTHTQKDKVIVVEHGYHGNTRIGIDISHYKYAHQGGTGKSAQIIESPLPDTFNGKYKVNDGTAGKEYAALTKEKITAEDGKIAAFIAEPIVGCGGQVPLAKGYLQEIYPAIRAQGGVCISDEVQVGFGRLGSHFWGYEQQEVIPDIVILGKPMANGHPIGAVVTTSAIAKSFENGMEFFSSFGGNPVSCAIAEAVLDVIEEEGLQQAALETGNYLMLQFKHLQERFPAIGDIRGSGLFLGIELVKADGSPNTFLAKHLKNELRQRHILVSTDGPFDNVIKIKPPLYFNIINANQLIKEVDSILSTTI